MGPAAADAIPALIEAAEDDSSKIGSHARDAIEQIGIQNTRNIEGLKELMSHSDRDVREKVIEALGFIGPVAIEAGDALLGALNDPDRLVRHAAIKSSGRVLPDFRAVPILEGMLKRGQVGVNEEIINSIANFLPESDLALGAIIRTLEYDRDTGEDAVNALVAVGPKVVPALIDALDNGNKNIRINSARALGSIGVDAGDSVPKLIVTLDDLDSEVRVEAANALGGIGAPSANALPRLREISERDNYVDIRSLQHTVRRAAREAIERIEIAIGSPIEEAGDEDGV